MEDTTKHLSFLDTAEFKKLKPEEKMKAVLENLLLLSSVRNKADEADTRLNKNRFSNKNKRACHDGIMENLLVLLDDTIIEKQCSTRELHNIYMGLMVCMIDVLLITGGNPTVLAQVIISTIKAADEEAKTKKAQQEADTKTLH